MDSMSAIERGEMIARSNLPYERRIRVACTGTEDTARLAGLPPVAWEYKSRLCPNVVCIEDETIECSPRDCEVEDLDKEDKCYTSSCEGNDEREL